MTNATCVCSDPLRGSKGSSFEGGTRVPAFLSGGLPALGKMRGRTLDGIVAIADFYSTILSLADLPRRDPNPHTVAPVDGVDQVRLTCLYASCHTPVSSPFQHYLPCVLSWHMWPRSGLILLVKPLTLREQSMSMSTCATMRANMGKTSVRVGIMVPSR